MKVRKAVILAGGLNTRMLPITKVIPKALLPIGNKPAIQYVIEECIESGINQITVVVRKGEELIQKYFAEDEELNEWLRKKKEENLLQELKIIQRQAKIKFAFQEQPLGAFQAILPAKGNFRGEAFAVLHADVIYRAKVPAIKQLIQISERERKSVDADSSRAVYLPQILALLEGVDYSNEERSDTEIMELIYRTPVVHYEIEGECFHIGEREDFLRAITAFCLQCRKV